MPPIWVAVTPPELCTALLVDFFTLSCDRWRADQRAENDYFPFKKAQDKMAVSIAVEIPTAIRRCMIQGTME